MEIAAGEFVAVLGPNGAGKSTMLNVVLGLLPLASGSVSVLGGPPARARDAVGYVPQRRHLDAGVRIRGLDLVRLGIDGARWGVPLPGASRWSPRARRDRDRVDEVIELVGAAAHARRPVGELSGGEQQRLLIAPGLGGAPPGCCCSTSPWRASTCPTRPPWPR